MQPDRTPSAAQGRCGRVVDPGATYPHPCVLPEGHDPPCDGRSPEARSAATVPDMTTPRPWAVEHTGSVAAITGAEDTIEVCQIDCSYESDSAAISASADADLIVQAVNQHDALLAIETMVREALDADLPDVFVRVAKSHLAALDEVRRG